MWLTLLVLFQILRLIERGGKTNTFFNIFTSLADGTWLFSCVESKLFLVNMQNGWENMRHEYHLGSTVRG